MKKILLLILFLIPFKVDAMSASSMVAVDLDNDYIYFDVNKDDKRLIASITKIMTAIVTIENIDISILAFMDYITCQELPCMGSGPMRCKPAGAGSCLSHGTRVRCLKNRTS